MHANTHTHTQTYTHTHIHRENCTEASDVNGSADIVTLHNYVYWFLIISVVDWTWLNYMIGSECQCACRNMCMHAHLPTPHPTHTVTHRHSTEASDVNGSIWCQSPVQDSIVPIIYIIYIPTVWFPRLITACSMKLQVRHNQVRTITLLYISTGFGAYNLLCWCHTWPVKIFTKVHYSISLHCPS